MNRHFTIGDVEYLVWGIRWTLALSLMAFAGGGILGLFIAIIRISNSRLLRYFAIGYIRVFQGTPLLIQLLVIFFLPAAFGIQVYPLVAAAIALSIHAGAYLGEIWRGCIEAVPKGQWEAAASLGLPLAVRLRMVILPQALRMAVPPTVGYLVQLVKDTSLASLIGFLELSFAGHLLVNSTFQPFLIYMLVAAGYFSICYPLAKASQFLERRLALAYK